MTVTERLMKPGRFDLQLTPDAPYSVRNAIREFDHIVITPTLVNPNEITDANMLSGAIYTGVVTGKPTPTSVTGQGLAYWLGTDQGLGDVLDTAVTQTAANLSTWINALRPSSISAGTVTNPAGTLSASLQWMSRREAIDIVCRYFGAEWKINPNGTLDAAVPATLHTNYTTPNSVITRKGEGSEGTLTGLQATEVSRSSSVDGYTTKAIVVGQRGDGAKVATGTATGANVYKDLLNNNVVMERLIDAPTMPASAVSSHATSVLALYSSLRQSAVISSDIYAVAFRVRPGDNVYVYDLDMGFVDTANQVQWRGEVIFPLKLRCRAYTWPIQRGMGVYARRSGATPVYTDLTNFVQWEDVPTQWEIGSSRFDPELDTAQLGGPYLGSHPGIVGRLEDADWIAYASGGFTNTTGVNGVTSYRVRGNVAQVQVNLTAGTVTAIGTISFAVPSFLTVAQNCTAIGSQGTTGLLAKLSTSGGCVIYANTTGGNWAAGAAINDLSLTLTFPIT